MDISFDLFIFASKIMFCPDYSKFSGHKKTEGSQLPSVLNQNTQCASESRLKSYDSVKPNFFGMWNTTLNPFVTAPILKVTHLYSFMRNTDLVGIYFSG